MWPNPTRVQSRIGVQLQKNALFENLTAAELLDLFARFYGVPLEGRAPRLLALVGLEEKADSQARQLSGGQQQRLAIALALVHDPEIVFLDEPTTGLDPQARRNLWDVIRAVAAENRTVVLTTHYLDEAETLCDRVAIMDGGRIIALDSPQALIDGLHGRSRVIFDGDGLGEDELAALEGVQSVTSADGVYELTSLEPQRTLLGLVALAEAARRRAARPLRAPADARGRLPRGDRHGVPRMNVHRVGSRGRRQRAHVRARPARVLLHVRVPDHVHRAVRPDLRRRRHVAADRRRRRHGPAARGARSVRTRSRSSCSRTRRERSSACATATSRRPCSCAASARASSIPGRRRSRRRS